MFLIFITPPPNMSRIPGCMESRRATGLVAKESRNLPLSLVSNHSNCQKPQLCEPFLGQKGDNPHYHSRVKDINILS